MIEVYRKKKESQGADYNVLLDKEDLDKWEHSDFALGLFSMSDMDYVLDRDETKQPSLDSLVKKAIHRLKKNTEGFFLMVEGTIILISLHTAVLF